MPAPVGNNGFISIHLVFFTIRDDDGHFRGMLMNVFSDIALMFNACGSQWRLMELIKAPLLFANEKTVESFS